VFGRKPLVAEVCALLRRRQVRLLSLIGPGGVGKTRVAVEVMIRLAPRCPEPPISIPLDGVQDADLVIPTIGQALGVRDGPERDAVDAVLDALHGRRPLLVLDNFEHLVDAAPALETIVEGCPDATVLVTSRIRLHIRGEQVVEVGPLPVPVEAESDPDALRRCPSVQLFVDRCHAVGVTAPPTGEHLVAVGEICRRLDGLPLALELAAARSRLLGVEGIRTHLGQVLDLLTGGPRDLPLRQQALRATIEWSYRLMTPACQQVLQRVAVFAGGFSVNAATAVCDRPRLEVLDALAALVDASLVGHVLAELPEGRLRLLQTLQDFALERLQADGGRPDAYRRHARYLLGLVEEADRALQGSDQEHWFHVLDQERDNVRLALETTVADNCVEEALRLTAAMWRYWETRGDLIEGRRWSAAALRWRGTRPTSRWPSAATVKRWHSSPESAARCRWRPA